jgi:hypothetical protein
MGAKRYVYKLLIGKLVEKRSLGRPTRGWADNIKIDLVEIGWGEVDYSLSQDSDKWKALVNATMNLRVP